ncbi:YggS family pyridoxal phosphate-dependent enzyme [Thalassoglobus sp. JC818]|uniref:YggS family pyridoxal phosphate-dependent enzyme n=1 Tax=Thalassoglobus sp. JC818 TaxID=3232136 RepID=UPI00345823E2
MSSPHQTLLNRILTDNLKNVVDTIESTCLRCDRDPSEIKLIAVTKYAPLEAVRELNRIGLRVYGENRPQQLVERAETLVKDSGWSPSEWHLIGQLQRNKVRAVLPHVGLIHSIDSVKLLSHVDRVAEENGASPAVLLQVNTSGEESKSGFTPEKLLEDWEQITAFDNVRLRGLMTMAPFTEETTRVRKTFSELRRILADLNATGQLPSMTELSMGMSSDYQIAIEEGATMIRLGSTLFEGTSELSTDT